MGASRREEHTILRCTSLINQNVCDIIFLLTFEIVPKIYVKTPKYATKKQQTETPPSERPKKKAKNMHTIHFLHSKQKEILFI